MLFLLTQRSHEMEQKRTGRARKMDKGAELLHGYFHFTSLPDGEVDSTKV